MLSYPRSACVTDVLYDMIVSMKPITFVAPFFSEPRFEEMLRCFSDSETVEEIIIVSGEKPDIDTPRCRFVASGPITRRDTLCTILDSVKTDYLLLLTLPRTVVVESSGLDMIIEKAKETKAGITYCDFYDETDDGAVAHPLNDYQLGSVRDDFDFGALMLFSMEAVKTGIREYGNIPDVLYAGIYDIRLKISLEHAVYHLREYLYTLSQLKSDPGREKIFAYVDPKQAGIQNEMEIVFTDHLKRIGAFLAPGSQHKAAGEENKSNFPVEASVVIPVRNRKSTVADAVRSALSQETDFSFNVIVVDNNSTDGTTELLSDLAKSHSGLKHLIPSRTDLGIGGCWNKALTSRHCGRYSVQLDSDDLYAGTSVLRRIVDMFRQGNYAMVIGSYTIVNFSLEVIAPGLIDHREWSDENGRNNALRINGLGAPRAFRTDIMRGIQFLNVSYGEDYAAALRMCREYGIGRIYENLYLCRRWPGNTDAALSPEAQNINDAFKDKIRTDEILARQKLNKKKEKIINA